MSDLVDKPDTTRLSALSHVALRPEERARFEADLGGILGHMRDLANVDLSTLAPDPPTVPPALRADTPHTSFTNEVALREAPSADDGGFEVPAFVDEG